MVPVGWADRPPQVLRRVDVGPGSTRCQIFAHDECELAPRTGTAEDGAGL
jgi:hypothetical protein